MKGLSYKWIVAIVVIFGVFMVLLDTTIVNIAVPNLQSSFGASLSDVAWVSTGYTLAEGIGIPLTPFFSALLGNKRFYLLLLTCFTIGSMLCGIAWSLPALIGFRILQGLAGASMIPMSITLLYSEFPPEERGIALGALGFPLMLAPALGPTVGGYLVTFVDWRVIFYINVPIGVIGAIMAFFLLRDTKADRSRASSFDFVGFIFSTAGLGFVLYALDKAGSDGWGSFTVVTFLSIGLASIIAFIITELIVIENGKVPLMDLRIFRTLSFSSGNIAMMTVIFALFGGQFLTPQYLQTMRGLSAYDAGVVLLPQALGSMVASLVGGRLVDKLGVKTVVVPGLLILGTALWGFSHLTLTTPLSQFQVLLIIRGLGLGLAMQPMTVAALAEIKPAQLSQASSINSVVRSVTSSLAVALVSTVVTNLTTFHTVRLAEQVTPDSAMGQGLQQQAAYFMGQGMPQQSAMFAAMGSTVKQLDLQAYLLAMNDAFLITLAVMVLTILVVLFLVRTPKKQGKSGGAMQEHMAFEGGPMEEEHTQSNGHAASNGHSISKETREEVTVAGSSKAVSTVAEGQSTGSHSRGAVSVAEREQAPAPRPNSAVIQERRKDTPMRRLMRRSVIIPAIILAIILVGGVVGYLIYNNYNFYSTDDAQVTGTIVPVTPPSAGTLINLDVEVGTAVSARQIIGTIQPIGIGPVQHLIAPMSGTIVAVPGVVGQLVGTTTTVAQETDLNSVKVTAFVDESAIHNVAVGQQVDIHVDAYNSTITGHVSQIVGATAGQFSLLPTTDNSSGNYTKVSQRIPVYVHLDTPSDGSLLPGMSVETTIHLH